MAIRGMARIGGGSPALQVDGNAKLYVERFHRDQMTGDWSNPSGADIDTGSPDPTAASGFQQVAADAVKAWIEDVGQYAETFNSGDQVLVMHGLATPVTVTY